MNDYTPPFTLTACAIHLIADIAAQTERFALRLAQPDGLLLRRANKIKSIRSSLAIEGNTLSENEVSDLLNGKAVVAPPRQIQEAKNAIATYDLYPKLNPFSVKDLLKAHGTMMSALVDTPGAFRRGGVGVVNRKGRILHTAPPALRVPELVSDLFAWLKNAPDHLLVKSCVFHYEFEFIHPFPDGNGRMGRLWQSLILSKWNPIFQHLPVENMVCENQQGYYKAINASTAAADSAAFIDFMLGEIWKTMQSKIWTLKDSPFKRKRFTENSTENFTEKERAILLLMRRDAKISTTEIARHLGVSRQTVATIVASLKTRSVLRRIGPDKGGRWEILNPKAPAT